MYRGVAATPQYRWALPSERLGTVCCGLQHENHPPVGAFKIRGGLTCFDLLARRGALPREVFSATRGNHGQSRGRAARRSLPHRCAARQFGEKNAAMPALGVKLTEHGADVQEPREHATLGASARGAPRVPRFHRDLV